MVGVRKSGTSALYMLFAENEIITQAARNKEHCPRWDLSLLLFQYLSVMSVPDQRKITVNGCINADIISAYGEIEREGSRSQNDIIFHSPFAT